MSYHEQVCADIEATIAAHVADDVEGICQGDHLDGQEHLYPCQERLWAERVAERHARTSHAEPEQR